MSLILAHGTGGWYGPVISRIRFMNRSKSRMFAILNGAGLDSDLNIFKQPDYFRIFVQDFPFAVEIVQKFREFANY